MFVNILNSYKVHILLAKIYALRGPLLKVKLYHFQERELINLKVLSIRALNFCSETKTHRNRENKWIPDIHYGFTPGKLIAAGCLGSPHRKCCLRLMTSIYSAIPSAKYALFGHKRLTPR